MSNFKFIRQGCAIIISGPSGCGKTSISKKILAEDENIITSVSYTTRAPRTDEIEGLNYHFVDQTYFSEMIITGQLLEYTEIHSNKYGTHRKILDEADTKGQDILFDIEANGAKALKDKLGLRCFSIFILPPSIKELENRLQSRAQDSQVNIKQRINNSKCEITQIKDYDYVIVNSNLEAAASLVLSIINSERMKKHRLINLDEYINKL